MGIAFRRFLLAFITASGFADHDGIRARRDTRPESFVRLSTESLPTQAMFRDVIQESGYYDWRPVDEQKAHVERLARFLREGNVTSAQHELANTISGISIPKNFARIVNRTNRMAKRHLQELRLNSGWVLKDLPDFKMRRLDALQKYSLAQRLALLDHYQNQRALDRPAPDGLKLLSLQIAKLSLISDPESLRDLKSRRVEDYLPVNLWDFSLD